MNRLFFLILFFPFFFVGQTQSKYPSLLWKITGNGIKKPSYVYGTMHVSNKVAFNLSEQFFEALSSVDVVGLETNPGKWLENMEASGELDEINRANYAYPYRGEFYKTVFALNFPEKRMLQGILSYDPDIIDGLLYRQTRNNANFEESTYIDLFIFQTASKLNKQIISLENFTESEIKARLASVPDQPNSQESTSYGIADYATQIENAYRDGNLDIIDSLSKIISSKNTQKFLIDDRNVFFVSAIDSVLKSHSLFSGVGAAHLPGDKGVIELLRAKGYKVEPVFPRTSKKSHQLRETLDQKIKPVTFSTQYLNDSLFSVAAPGKFYPIVSLNNLKYYIHADMVNGSFYTIVRLKHLGPMFGVTPELLYQRMDSLLFENIPGKITLKKEIVSNTGVKGLEIINRTRNGNEQHYHIYFTNLELIIFKLGGKQSYASGNEAKQFFKSIRFTPKSSNYFNFSPATKGFQVSIPNQYQYSKNGSGTQIGSVENLFAFDESQHVFYGLQHAVYNDFAYLEADTFELNQFKKQILKHYKFDSLIHSNISTEQGFPCIYFNSSNKTGNVIDAKVFIKGVHYYFVYRISDKPMAGNEFLNSFKLIDFEHIHPIKEIKDNEFLFKVQDEVTDNALSRFNELYAKTYDLEMNDTKEKQPDFDYTIKSKYYYSPSSEEYVAITYEKYNDYDYRDTSSLQEKIVKNLNSNNSLFIKSQQSVFNQGQYTYSCTMSDTATCRAIALKLFVKNGLMHEILAPFDTTIGLKGWTKGFFESFTPLDTVIGKNIFENKFSQLLNDLTSSDTLIRNKANASVLSIGVQTTYANAYIEFINSNKLNLVNEDSKAQLFVNGGTLETENIIVPYKNLYTQYTDSFYLQLCLLKGLAYLKTQKSYTEFYNLLMNETPLVGAGNTVEDVFFVLHDSLELCKQFFPGILTLTRYEEYRNAIYTLLADMVNQNLIPSGVYANQLDAILTDANLELKRFTPANNRISSDQNANSFSHLDNLNQEIAFGLSRSLQAINDNKRHRGTKHLKILDTYDRSPLISYLWIVSPFYKSNDKVKQFFAKLSKIKSINIAMPLCIQELKLKINTNDTMLVYFSKNNFTKNYFYSELIKAGLEHQFDKTYLSQTALIESVILSQTQLNKYYGYEKENAKKDSLQFLKVIEASNKYESGKLYIFKNSKAKNEDESWSVAFVNSKLKMPTPDFELIYLNYYIDKNLSLEANLNELRYDFSLSYRNRAQVLTNSYSN